MKPTPFYDQDGITIYHGDCAQVLPFLDPVDLLLTDPPYGIGASSGVGKYGVMKWGGVKDDKWDDQIPPLWIFEQMMTKAKLHIIWGGNYFPLPPSRGYFIWDKGEGMAGRTFAECEYAWCSMDMNAKIIKRDPLASGDYRGKVHPTQKPLAVINWCIQQAGECETILDPFMGSGTTLVAAKNQGKRCIGIERELKYCKIAVDRLSQQTLFQFEPPNTVMSRTETAPDPSITTAPKTEP